MEASVRRLPGGGLTHQTVSEAESAAEPELKCRVCELETENSRLRLLVGELLVANQRLRERSQAARTE